MTHLTASLFCLYTESPLHVGSTTGVGAIDLPIQRERFTGLPLIPGSALKGALREEASERAGEDQEKKGLVEDLFGPRPPQSGKDAGSGEESSNESAAPADAGSKASEDGKRHTRLAPSDFAGAVGVGDARLLLLPVRSARAGWAWLTSPLCLQRLARDLEVVGLAEPPSWATLEVGEGVVLVSTASKLVAGSDKSVEQSLILEDLQYGVTGSTEQRKQVDELAQWIQGVLPRTVAYAPYRARLPEQLVVMSDEEFTDLAEHVTEIHTRVRLTETRTVQTGALWTEETLPSESLLWSLVFFDRKRRKGNGGTVGEQTREDLRKLYGWAKSDVAPAQPALPLQRLRLGGDLSVGRGLVAVQEFGGES